MICANCRHENPPAAKFCAECGSALSAEFPSARAGRSERKQVTILFSDLSGYTAMNERLDPEEVRDIMSRVFGEIAQVIARYDGFLERFIGDAVMAVFGVPAVHEDDPVRAIRAALDIHAVVAGMSPKLEPRVGRPLGMHSGINTGLVVTGVVDPERGTHGLTGDAVNLASRLQGLAAPGEILVSESTRQLARGHFRFEPMAPAQVKGKARPVLVYRVFPSQAPESRKPAGRRVSSVMVGRDRELDLLELQVHKALNGQGSVVNLIGEAGVGKSRLIAELKRREVMQRVTLLEGQAISIGRNLSFHPIIDMLKQWAGIAENDSGARALDKLDRAIRDVHPEEADEILPFVATLMGMKLSGRQAQRVEGLEGEALEKLILKNVRELLIKGSQQRATVLILEDLHWADTSSLELIEPLHRLAGQHRLLFINVFRPAYLDEAARRTTGDHLAIRLQPLGERDSETLINNMLEIRGLPFAVKEKILVRAGGNPFFIEEVVRSLIDQGAVIREEGGFTVTPAMERVVIPPTIKDVLMARIDRLDDATRELVRVAAVIGRSFFDRVIKDVAGGVEGVGERLAYLKEVQLVSARTRMGELEYYFRHALVREAAYQSILIQQRGALHLKVAASIEKLFPEKLHEFYGMLAFHYAQGEDLAKAEEFMTRAGEEALRASASSEALHYLQQALNLYVERYGNDADPATVISFKENLAQAQLHRGKFLEAINLCDDILRAKGYKVRGAKTSVGPRAALEFALTAAWLYSPWQPAQRMPRKEEIEYFDLISKKGIGLVHINTRRMFLETILRPTRFFLCVRLDRVPQGLNWAGYLTAAWIIAGFPSLGARLLARTREMVAGGDGKGRTELAVAGALLAIHEGTWDNAPELDGSLVELGLRNGELYGLTPYLLHLGCAKVEVGQFGQAERCAGELYSIIESYDYKFAQVHYHFLKANILARTSDLFGALREAEAGVQIADQAGMDPPKLRFLGLKAVIEDQAGRFEQAAATVDQGEAVRAGLGGTGPLYLAPHLLGKLLHETRLLGEALAREDGTEIQKTRKAAGETAKQALKVSGKHALFRVWILQAVGEYHWVDGRRGKALKWWGRAVGEGRRLGALTDLSRACFTVGKHLLAPDSPSRELDGRTARQYLDQAGDLFRQLNLQRDLDELERFSSG